jgi:flagellar biosynthesis protein FlhF
LVEVLRREMIFAPGLAPNGPRVVALVGPTGVGKTTTLAKLAAKAALIDRRRVGLISVDDYRIAGAEQLGRYADLIGVPMEVAHDARSLEVALRRLADADLILVDTAGRSPRDTDATRRTAETLHGAQEGVEVQLCVAAATGHAELRVTVEQNAVLRPRKLLITKLDEAVRHGGIVGAQVMAGLPLTYFTTGQRVPEDIEVASPERVASLLIGESLERT